MKIQKLHLLVVFLLLIVFSVYVLRPSIYPSSYYEYATQPTQEQHDDINVALGCNRKKSGVCKTLLDSGALQSYKAYVEDLEEINKQLGEANSNSDAVDISTSEDTSAKIGLLQTQIKLLNKTLTDRMNQSITTQIRRVDSKINAALIAINELLDEDGNILVDKIQNTELSNRIKEVIAEDRGSELIGLRSDIDTNEGTIDKNKTDQSTDLNTLSQLINARISEYQNTNTAELSNLGKEIKTTNNNVISANSDIASVQAELEGVDLAQLTYYVGNNIVDIADISRTVATIIPYTEFRDDLRDTYRQQYLSHLDTEH